MGRWLKHVSTCLLLSARFKATEELSLLLSFTPWHPLVRGYVGVKFRNPCPAEQGNKIAVQFTPLKFGGSGALGHELIP